MGGGLASFIPITSKGRRSDGRDLTSEWIQSHPNGRFVTSKNELLKIDDDIDFVLGLFSKSHLSYDVERDDEVEPSLAEMTQSAIKTLQRNNSDGFLLVVEGGKIDLAHHLNKAYLALTDTLAFDDAIRIATESVGKLLVTDLSQLKLNVLSFLL